MNTENKLILHIANDYAGSAVYKNLVRELDGLDIPQIVYTPLRGRSKVGVNNIKLRGLTSKIVYSPILNWHIDRIFYPYKIYKILKDIESKVDFSKVKCIHAHTWYSDGGVAYLLSKKYCIPFVVTVRNTDINLFQDKLVYLRPFGKKILARAKQIVLVSASYRERLLRQSSLNEVAGEIQRKLRVIPNGVDPYWINNVTVKPQRINVDDCNFLYVGRFTSGKQVPTLQKAVISLNRGRNRKIKLHLVGGGGKDEQDVLDIAKSNPDMFVFHGEIRDKASLQTVYKKCDIFSMPSRHETFGLVYIEAMLQGLPVLYTDGEGIDGFYSEKIGGKVSDHSVDGIKLKLKTMVDNFEKYLIPLGKIQRTHDWVFIARDYRAIYDYFD